MKPRLLLATLDGDCLVTVRFHRRFPIDRWPLERFRITNETGQNLAVTSVLPVRPQRGKAARYLLNLAEPIDVRRHAWKLTVDDIGELPMRMGRLLQDGSRFGDPEAVLGATYTPTATTFRVFAPTAQAVRVIIADRLEGNEGRHEWAMAPLPSGIWEAAVEGDLQGKYYAYALTGIGFDPNQEITDIYAVCTQGRHARSLIVDLPNTDPPGFREHPVRQTDSPTDAIIYEMHVRDFTIAASSGVRHKGKYLGLTEADTHLPDDPAVRTGVDHLSELGVTHVQLMPVQDFDNLETDDDSYNWGYMPAFFNSPDGWYATSREGPGRILELKQAIQTFHERGIGVILDVVYNHTSSRATFERLVPDYYYRRTCAGRFANGSGCGNEFRSESPMARKFLLDSLAYWVRQYRVDGFRFDLMALIDVETMQRVKAELEAIRPGILIYGEPWTAGPTPLGRRSDRRRLRGMGIGRFNDYFRNGIKGDVNGVGPGYIQAGRQTHDIRHGLQGSIHLYSASPVETVNYFECHDNLTACDKLSLSVPGESEETRKRMLRFAALILFASQGLILMHAGQEFCRTKKGSHNSYNLPDDVNQIDWSLKKRHADVWAYHRGMIAIRRTHPLLRLRSRDEVRHRLIFSSPPNPQCVVCRLKGNGLPGEPAKQMLLLLNGDVRSVNFDLPDGDWGVLADADTAAPQPSALLEGKVSLAPHSGMLLAR